MPSISVPAAIIGAGAISAGTGLVSGVLGSNASKQAADTQAQAADEAAQVQMNMFNTTQANLQPYMQAGQGALAALQGGIGTGAATAGGPGYGSLIAPFQPTMQQLAQTPGYQFTLQQGLQAAQNGFAAQGLGSSGSAIKGAANYAEGLASTTYQQQFQNYLTQNQQIYNMLGGVASQGENAAANLGNVGVNTGSNVGNSLMSAGAASAAGTVGSTNALTSALSGIGSTTSNTGLLLALNNQGLFGGSPVSVDASSTF